MKTVHYKVKEAREAAKALIAKHEARFANYPNVVVLHPITKPETKHGL